MSQSFWQWVPVSWEERKIFFRTRSEVARLVRSTGETAQRLPPARGSLRWQADLASCGRDICRRGAPRDHREAPCARVPRDYRDIFPRGKPEDEVRVRTCVRLRVRATYRAMRAPITPLRARTQARADPAKHGGTIVAGSTYALARTRARVYGWHSPATCAGRTGVADMTFPRQSNPICGRCRQRAHTYCAQPCACPCEGAYRKVSNATPDVLYCPVCGYDHERGLHGMRDDLTPDDDVRAFMGERGYFGADDRATPACEHPSRVCRHAPVISDGWTFVWSARAGAYRYVTNRATTRDMMREDNARARGLVRVRRSRTSQPKRSVTISSVWNAPTIARDGARMSRVTALARGGYGL